MKQLDGPRLPPAGGGAARSLVVLLHGFGADGNDLIGLGQYWASSLPGTYFVAPHAPQPCTMAPSGRQWFPLSMRDPDEYWRGVTEAAPALNAFLDAELERHSLPPERMALVGFSQGTMMSLHVGLRREKAPACIVGFSGLLAGVEDLDKDSVGRPPIVLVHGDRDDVLPMDFMFAAANMLNAIDIPVEWHISRGIGHGIDENGLAIGSDFLKLGLK